MAVLKFKTDQGYWPDRLKNVLDNGQFVGSLNTPSTSIELKAGDFILKITGSGLAASSGRVLSAGTISGFELRGPDGVIFTETDFATKPTRANFQKILTHLDASSDVGIYHGLLTPVFFHEAITATGQAGFDWFRPSAMADSFDGKGDFNFIEYFYETGSAGVTFNFQTGKVTDSHGNIDTIKNIAGAGGTTKADTFIGSTAVEDHFWVGDDGADTYRGNVDVWETIGYKWEAGTKGVVANLKTGKGTDTFGKVETYINIDAIEGSKFADTLTGSDGDNFFAGFGGADKIDGGKGWDTVGYREESERGGSGGVIVNLSASAVTADVGRGSKTVAAGTALDSYGKTDTLKNIEGVEGTNSKDVLHGNSGDNHLEGNDGNDILYGGGGNDNLRGSAGNDQLFGGSGNDRFKGGRGNELIDGGSGWDRVNYFLETPASGDTSGKHGVIVNLSTAKLVGISITGVAARDVAAGTAVDATGGIDTLKSIEHLETTEFQDHVVGNKSDNEFILGAGADRAWGGAGNDYLEGGSGSDTLRGDAGHDGLNGGSGNDKLYGGAGDDFFEGGAGNDLISGGAGWDKLSYADEKGGAGIKANMTTGKITDTYGDTDTLTGIEGIKGSRYADTFVGSSGKDSFEGLAGKDKFDGKGGEDRVEYQFESNFGAKQGVIVNLSTSSITADIGKGSKTVAAGTAIDGFGAVDTLISIEHINGTDRADHLVGSSARNELAGLGGDDRLIAGAGDDWLFGGAGRDVMSGGAGSDEYFFEELSDLGKTAATRDVITDFGTPDYINLRNIDANTKVSGDQAFIFKAAQSKTFDGTVGQLIWSQENPSGTANDKTIVMGDINGDKVADFHIELKGLIAVNSGDFLL